MMRQRSRLDRLRRAMAKASGRPDCQEQFFQIIEVVVDRPGATAAGEPPVEPAAPAQCGRCGRPVQIQFVEIALDEVTGVVRSGGVTHAGQPAQPVSGRSRLRR